ncbi:unnamed protein product [Trichobilharzia regenti]|nr:unnamed protein product [Trichobilharzia regenti]
MYCLPDFSCVALASNSFLLSSTTKNAFDLHFFPQMLGLYDFLCKVEFSVNMSDFRCHRMLQSFGQQTIHKVIAYDSGEPNLSASTNIHVILDDINDCVPTFSQPEYNFTIDEDFMQNYTASRIIGLVAATDCDIGLNGMLIYSILDPGLPFEVSFK